MNNLITHILGISDETSDWAYINNKGHVIHCTRAQYWSYHKKKKVEHEKCMREAYKSLFAPCPFYFWLKRKIKRKEAVK